MEYFEIFKEIYIYIYEEFYTNFIRSNHAIRYDYLKHSCY